MAKEGMTLCFGHLTITIMVWLLWLYDGRNFTLGAAVALTVLTAFFFYFFRDPNRKIPDDKNALISPADGRVVAVKNIGTHAYLNSPAVQISIFLSPLDVHINRIPASGTIEFVNYRKGKFLMAFNDLASEQNEQTEIGLVTDAGQKIVFKQIAGWLARRIVCRLERGQKVSAGEKFGMIKFGSRTDLIIPADFQIETQPGRHVTGGETILARTHINSATTTSTTPSGKNNA